MADIITPEAPVAPTDLKCKLNPRWFAGADGQENALAPGRGIGQTGLPQSRMISGLFDLKSESVSKSKEIEHDVVRKPLHTFRHHALVFPSPEVSNVRNDFTARAEEISQNACH
ncbi:MULTISPECIES: hypothetical protein [unclassified Mesorhizobium]|uniref:hypothetical protein n=1 Tax=unclassified Mesorhizobium TaxID=325217 RepID=UPI00163D60BC|nr:MULTISPECIES: hypothetical protein [unclassified Mesorhizobium]